MAAVLKHQDAGMGAGHPVPVALTGRPEKRTYLANLPVHNGRAGLIGYTPQLQELISDAMPVAWHVMDRRERGSEQPLHLFYVNPRESLECNASRLAEFLRCLAGKHRTWLPLSSSHTLILPTMLMCMPQLVGCELSSLTLLHIGDCALRPGLELFARDSGMSYCFHALY